MGSFADSPLFMLDDEALDWLLVFLDDLPVERVERERLPVVRPVERDDSMASDSFMPAVFISCRPVLLERISSAQSLTCSLRRLISSLISLRFDHRKTPAATAPAAAAAVFIGLSRAVSPHWPIIERSLFFLLLFRILESPASFVSYRGFNAPGRRAVAWLR
jgi:hypothetical protein